MTNSDRYSDGSYLAAHPDWHASRSPWKAQHVVDGLAAVGISPTTICDIGCGTGRTLALVRRSLPSVQRAVGFEPSPDAPVHEDAAPLIDVQRVDATTVADRFDVALMLDVFEHVPDYLGFLRDCRHLADHFVFHVPLEISALSVLAGRLGNSRRSVGHLHLFTRRTALDTLRDCGFEICHDTYTKSGWDGADRRGWSPLNVLRRVSFRISPGLTERVTGGLSLLVVAKVG